MGAPIITVIVPIYNSKKYLESCINSILSQTFKDFECLLIDDCSTDDSLEICKNFQNKDNRVKVYHKNTNEGTAQARKTGVFYAAGEYTMFVDHDDWVEPTMLEALYTEIKSEKYDMVCCDFFHEYPKETIYMKQEIGNKTNSELIKEIIVWGDFLPVTWNKLIKTEIYRKIIFPTITYSEDRVIMVQALYFCNKIGYINKALYHWCHIQKSASRASKRNIRNLIENYIASTAILLFIVENEINAVKMTNEIVNHIDNLGFLCWDNKKILAVYKNAIKKILELKLENKLTTEILVSEQNNIEKTIIKLDSRNYKKIILKIRKSIKKSVLWLLKIIIPKKIRRKIRSVCNVTLIKERLRFVKNFVTKAAGVYFNYAIHKRSRFANTLSIVSIIRNEAPYLKEWIEYHKLIGFERFYIYDNYSTDDIMDVLRPYIASGEVVYTLFPSKESHSNENQIDAYNDAIKRYRNKTKWLALIDVDEFMAPLKKKRIVEILKEAEDTNGPHFASIEIPWVLYGYSGNYKKPEGLVIENYTRSCDKTKLKELPEAWSWMRDDFFKSIINPRMAISYHIHDGQYLFGQCVIRMDKETIRLNHYWTKSFEEFSGKINRNSNWNPNSRQKYKIIPEYDPDFLSHKEETVMRDYVEALKERMGTVERTEHRR